MLSKSDKGTVLKEIISKNGGKKASKSGGGGNNGKCKSNIAILEKKVRNQTRQLAVFNTVAKYVSENEDSYESDK